MSFFELSKTKTNGSHIRQGGMRLSRPHLELKPNKHGSDKLENKLKKEMKVRWKTPQAIDSVEHINTQNI